MSFMSCHLLRCMSMDVCGNWCRLTFVKMDVLGCNDDAGLFLIWKILTGGVQKHSLMLESMVGAHSNNTHINITHTQIYTTSATHISHILRTPHTPHTYRTSHITHHTSHITHHTLHTSHTRHMIWSLSLSLFRTNVYSLLSPADYPQIRSGFTNYHLWVTPFNRSEIFSSGMFPNQNSEAAGLPVWTEANRNLVNTDLVVWYVMYVYVCCLMCDVCACMLFDVWCVCMCVVWYVICVYVCCMGFINCFVTVICDMWYVMCDVCDLNSMCSASHWHMYMMYVWCCLWLMLL